MHQDTAAKIITKNIINTNTKKKYNQFFLDVGHVILFNSLTKLLIGYALVLSGS